jgi:MFS transporter, DHA1 family, tetracycline resistance protein
METTFALWAHSAFGWGPREVGYNFLFVGVVLVVVQGFLIGPLTRRFGETRLVLGGAGLIALGLLGLPFALTLPRLLGVNVLLALGMGVLNPAITSLISQSAEIDERGGILGVSQSASSLSRILGPLVAGLLFEGLSRDAPYYAGAALMALVVALALRLPGERVTAAVQSESAPS